MSNDDDDAGWLPVFEGCITNARDGLREQLAADPNLTDGQRYRILVAAEPKLREQTRAALERAWHQLQKGSPMTTEAIGPAEAAALLLAWLDHHGAPVTLDFDGGLAVDLSGIRLRDARKADGVDLVLVGLRGEITAHLVAARIVH